MRHIPGDSIVARSTSSEDPNFPLSMVADDHPKRVYKALPGVSDVTVSLDIIGGCSDIMLAGTNVMTAEITVSDPNFVEWGDGDAWQTGDSWPDVISSVTSTVIQREKSKALWVQLSSTVSIPCIATLNLHSKPIDTLSVGIIRAGIAETYGANPNYGLKEGRVDYSIIDLNSNGSRYYKKRDIVREFDLTLEITRDNAWKLAQYFDSFGEKPMAWKLTDLDNNNWLVFACISDTPGVSHDYPTTCVVNVKLTEVL